jgi:hypothetical protein
VTTAYLLYYDTDYGNREEWNFSYTPIEVFTDEETRDRRIEFIKKNYRDLTILKEDVVMNTPWNSPLDNYEMDSDTNDQTNNSREFTQTEIFLQAFDRQLETGIHLDPTKLDSDGYTIWEGGDYRPVDKDTIVAVKVRGKIPRDPIRAGAWPQICWMHRHKDDDMNKWDIVAYKVLK